MKHVLILRALGFVLVIALAVNITAVLAAPLYLGSSNELAQKASTKPKPKLPAEPAEDAVADTTFDETIVIVGDIVQSEPTVVPDSSEPAQTAVETDLTLDVVDGQETASPTPRKGPTPLEGMVRSEGQRLFFDLGVQIGAQSHRQPLAAAVNRFLRRRPSVTANHEDDLLPTVVISDPHTERTNATEEPASADLAVPASNASPDRIVIENPTEYTVMFQLDGRLQTLKPGAALIETKTQSVIRFDRGGDFGEFREELAAGQYQFGVSREGWKLEKAEEDAASL